MTTCGQPSFGSSHDPSEEFILGGFEEQSTDDHVGLVFFGYSHFNWTFLDALVPRPDERRSDTPLAPPGFIIWDPTPRTFLTFEATVLQGKLELVCGAFEFGFVDTSFFVFTVWFVTHWTVIVSTSGCDLTSFTEFVARFTCVTFWVWSPHAGWTRDENAFSVLSLINFQGHVFGALTFFKVFHTRLTFSVGFFTIVSIFLRTCAIGFGAQGTWVSTFLIVCFGETFLAFLVEVFTNFWKFGINLTNTPFSLKESEFLHGARSGRYISG